jgi:hypothetical protein
MYREQEYVDRCYCDEPATAHCAMCNRARCAAHQGAHGRCHRCNEAMGYEMAGRAGAWWTGAIAVGVGSAFALMLAHAVLLAVPISGVGAAATFLVMRARHRRSAERLLAPRLAASTGEVDPAVDRTGTSEVGNHPTEKSDMTMY